MLALACQVYALPQQLPTGTPPQDRSPADAWRPNLAVQDGRHTKVCVDHVYEFAKLSWMTVDRLGPRSHYSPCYYDNSQRNGCIHYIQC